MQLKEVIKILTLEAIQKLGKAPCPAIDNWGYLYEVVEDLELEDLLQIDSTETYYELTRDGKKTLALFKMIRDEEIKSNESYKEVFVGHRYLDARIPVLSFKLRYKFTDPQIKEQLLSLAVFLYWDTLIDKIAKMEQAQYNWQADIANGEIFRQLDKVSHPLAWTLLGTSQQDAERTAMFLLNPKPTDNSLVQITRH